ncbi:MAG: hypothetical protein ACO27P_09280, partial [Burkholderiaceae bacterium]
MNSIHTHDIPGPISLTQYLIQKQRQSASASSNASGASSVSAPSAARAMTGELRLLLEVVARACKRISYAVGKGALAGHLGDA